MNAALLLLALALPDAAPGARPVPASPPPPASVSVPASAPALAPASAPAKPPAPPPVRPAVVSAVKEAKALLLDFEEAKAVAVTDAVLAQHKDLTPEEMGLVQMWRGFALASVFRQRDAKVAFAEARACHPKLVAPADVSPKLRAEFMATVAQPTDCTVVRPEDKPPPPVVAAADTGVQKAGQAAPGVPGEGGGGGGPPVLGLAGLGGVAVGLVGVVLSGALAAVALGVLVSSFPLVFQANAEPRAADAIRLGVVALVLRVGGGLGGLATGAVGVLGVAVACLGVAVAVVGFLIR